ncbi:hypothetical protein C4D60_Mb02t15730 [Musa balbisiana]|uniref:Uncharacterized protein n=1 Tax=Musa balbisiana TaxID=52838 RepID=A0A4S8IAZ1_MUSBA|nr:hypothetical protein C4D60_Mb02t15730 [Musa balbisiana]
MEEITEGVSNPRATAADSHKKNRIQVSKTKKPLCFDLNLAKQLQPLMNPGVGASRKLGRIDSCRGRGEWMREMVRRKAESIPPAFGGNIGFAWFPPVG